MSETHLKSIKSRMGWQIGLQAATLAAVGSINSSISEQTQVLEEKLISLEKVTIEGFESVSEAINSLESSLINGIEEIKWFLGSIDDKLGKIIGLIEYSRATESSEQFKIGMELYKQELYQKALKCFEASVEKNPLNLNAKAGFFLTKKHLKKLKDYSILSELVKLTGSDFLYHMKAPNDIKESKANYFINFSFGELLEGGKYNDIISLYENEIEPFSKEHLPIKLKYINALVLLGKEYTQYVDDILTEGQLEKLMLFFKYEKKNKHVVKFIQDVTNYIKIRIPSEESYKISDTSDTVVEIKAKYFKSKLYSDIKTLLELGFYQTALSVKVKGIKTFLGAARSAPEHLKQTQNLSTTNTKNLSIINEIKTPKFFSTNDVFAKDALDEIVNDTTNQIKNYKKLTSEDLKKEDDVLKKAISQFSTGYPKLEQDSNDTYEIVNVFIKNIDEEKQIINLENIFSHESLRKNTNE